MRIKSLLLAMVFSTITCATASAAYELVWQDNFDGNSINSTAWHSQPGGDGGGNNESQYYTSRPDNMFISNGNLVIRAKREAYGGKPFTSGRLTSEGHVSCKYGIIEARIKTPAGTAGVWPAFWMLGNAIGSCGWPTCGEIDIMEEMGTWDAASWNKNLCTLHWNPNDGCNDKAYATYSLNTNFGEQVGARYRIFGVEWTSSMIIGYWKDDNGNRTEFYWCNIESIPAFHREFFLRLNVALGGSYVNYTVDDNFQQDDMLVDWVRIYQDKSKYPGSSLTNNSNLSGGGTVTPDPDPEPDPQPTCNSTDRAVATFYADADYAGAAVALPEGTYTTSQMGEWCLDNDVISSVRVLPGYKVTVYVDNNFGGTSASYTSDVSNVGGTMNDKISSIRIEASGVSGLSGVHKIKGYNGKYMDLDGNSTNDNTHVVQWLDEGTEAYQQWYFNEIGNGVYNILPNSNHDKAMDLYYGKVDNRTELLVYQNNNTSNQQYIVVDKGNGWVQLVARYCGKVLEDPDFSTKDGEYIKLYDNNNQTCSYWKLEEPQHEVFDYWVIYRDNLNGMSSCLDLRVDGFDAWGGTVEWRTEQYPCEGSSVASYTIIANDKWFGFGALNTHGAQNFSHISDYTLHFYCKTNYKGILNVKFSGGDGEVLVPFSVNADGKWHQVTIPVSSFVNAGTKLQSAEGNLIFSIVGENVTANGEFVSIDDVYFYRQSPVSIVLSAGDAEGEVVRIYPNPTTDVLNVSGIDGDVALFDLAGRMMMRSYVDGDTELDVRSLQAGHYILRAGGASYRIIKR